MWPLLNRRTRSDSAGNFPWWPGSAWARGDKRAVFQVRDICDSASLDSPRRYSLCCEILDSDRFSRRERLEYHHRTGVWGTGDATYTFTFATRRPLGPNRMLRAVLWLLLTRGRLVHGLVPAPTDVQLRSHPSCETIAFLC